LVFRREPERLSPGYTRTRVRVVTYQRPMFLVCNVLLGNYDSD
jgi:hypothetical protein